MIEWLKESWKYLAAAVAAITLIWNFKKLVKEIKTDMSKPFTDINEKIDNLSSDLNGKIDKLSVDVSAKVDNLEAKIDRAEENDKQVRSALMNIQRASLLKTCEDFIKRGFATVDEKDMISKQYSSYMMIRNQEADKLVSDIVGNVNDLPLEKQIKKKKTEN